MRSSAAAVASPVAAVLRAAIGLGAAFLLTSIGGAQVMVAPLSIPALLWAVATARTSVARVLLSLVAGATWYMASAFAAHQLWPDAEPWISLGGVLLFLAFCAWLSFRAPRPSQASDPVSNSI